MLCTAVGRGGIFPRGFRGFSAASPATYGETPYGRIDDIDNDIVNLFFSFEALPQVYPVYDVCVAVMMLCWSL